MKQIKTIYCPKPIPLRSFDYEAWFDGEEEICVGYGETEEQAVNNLIDEMELIDSTHSKPIKYHNKQKEK